MVEVQSHECVAGFQACEQYGSICLCSGVRLYVGELSPEEFLYSFPCQILHLVNDLATSIVSLAWQSFCILVGEA